MKKPNKLVLIASLALFAAVRLCAQQPSPQADERVVVFRFLPGNDMFYVPWADNRAARPEKEFPGPHTGGCHTRVELRRAQNEK